MNEEQLQKIRQFQINEITEYNVYSHLSNVSKDRQNREVLKKIAADELRHYQFWKKYTNTDYLPDSNRIKLFVILAKVLGLSFTVKLMELGEEDAQKSYNGFVHLIPNIKEVITDEDRHEKETLKLIHDQYLKFAGSIVLGFNDALVELTGALAGLTFALQNSKIIAVSGLITGVAAAFSMAASEYLSLKAEEKKAGHALKSSVYTGIVYITVVILLVLPYLLISEVYVSLAVTLSVAILIVTGFSFYISVAQQVSFKRQFTEMASLSLGTAVITFIFGIVLRNLMGLEI